MRQIHVEASDAIDASPEIVYGIFADYHHEHPHILPKRYFTDLEVEEGGVGAGTVFRVASRRIFGASYPFRMTVAEPEPGRVLTETDLDSGLVTTFTVNPLDGGRRSDVRIATVWRSKPGLAGFIEAVMSPTVMRRIYRSELRQLAAYVHGKPATEARVEA